MFSDWMPWLMTFSFPWDMELLFLLPLGLICGCPADLLGDGALVHDGGLAPAVAEHAHHVHQQRAPLPPHCSLFPVLYRLMLTLSYTSTLEHGMKENWKTAVLPERAGVSNLSLLYKGHVFTCLLAQERSSNFSLALNINYL